MSVLQRKELEDSPLADLHAIASELGLESYRRLRKADLVDTILGATGADEGPADDAAAPVATAEVEEAEPDEVPEEEALERPSRRRRRGGRGRKAAEPKDEAEPEPEAAAVEDEPEDEAPAEEETIVTGVLDILPNGSGFLRSDGKEAYVSPAQIRRCELRAGDELSGPVRPPRRNERHASLIRVDTVNGGDPESPEERPRFEDLTPIFPRERLKAPKSLDALPLGRGSRVAVAGAPGAGATTLLRELAGTLAGEADVELQIVLAGVRPEEIAEWREVAGDAPVLGGSFERSPESLAQETELAIERAKRRVERGAHAAVLIDSLTGLPPAAARRLFGAARATDGGGTLTVVASVGEADEPLRWATSRVVLAAGTVDSARSGTLNADRLS
jgi:transcription termination factor Rho